VAPVFGSVHIPLRKRRSKYSGLSRNSWKSPEYPGFTNKIVLSGDFQNSPIHPPLGDIKIFQDHLKFLKHMQRLKLLSILPTLCRNYRGVRYFWYMVGTIDMAEEVKTKF
jgi:hypothetical protein